MKRKYDWWAADDLPLPIPVQDTVHLVAKLRVADLKVEKMKPIGNYITSPTDFITLKSKVPRDQHLLKEGDLNLLDKMNYDASARLASPHLEPLMKKYVPGRPISYPLAYTL